MKAPPEVGFFLGGIILLLFPTIVGNAKYLDPKSIDQYRRTGRAFGWILVIVGVLVLVVRLFRYGTL